VPLSELLSLAIGLLLAGIFSLGDAALHVLGAARAEKLVDEGRRSLRRFVAQPEGTHFALLLGKVGAALVSVYAGLALFDTLSWPRWVALSFLVLALFAVEAVPRCVAGVMARRMAPGLMTLMWPWLVLSQPLGVVLARLGRAATPRRSGTQPPIGQDYEEDLELLIDASARHGSTKDLKHRILRSVVDFKDTIVREVMVPRTDLVACSLDASFDDVLRLFIDEGYSRVPVYRNNVDEIVGVLYAKDLFEFLARRYRGECGAEAPLAAKDAFSLVDLIRDAFYVPETKHINELFKHFQREHIHIAIVVDEFGGTAGVVTLEDIIEEFFGEIQDEYDQEENPIVAMDGEQQVLLVDARTSIDDVAAALDMAFPDDADYDTIGGFVVSTLGKVPDEGEAFVINDVCLTVIQATEKRVVQVQIERLPVAGQGSEVAAAS